MVRSGLPGSRAAGNERGRAAGWVRPLFGMSTLVGPALAWMGMRQAV
jgi:hypothetical protein